MIKPLTIKDKNTLTSSENCKKIYKTFTIKKLKTKHYNTQFIDEIAK